jgi:hypothetical protein
VSAADLAGNLAAYAIQLACVVLAAALLEAALPIDRPRVRLVYWNGILALCIGLPLLQPWAHRAPEPVAASHAEPPAPARPDARVETPPLEPVTIAPSRPAPADPVPPAGPSVSPTVDVAPIALGVLLAGAVFGTSRLLRGLHSLRGLRRRSEALPPAASGLVDCVAELRLSREIASPVTFGVRSAVILLPSSFEDLDADERRGVVCHELVHVERRHWPMQVMEELLRAALWFHPAVHWLLGRIRLAREQSVDTEVVRRLSGRKAYLEALVRMAASAQRLTLVPAPSLFTRSHLAERVDLLLKEKPMSKTRVLLSLLASAVVVGAIATAAPALAPLYAAPPAPPAAPEPAAPVVAVPIVASPSSPDPVPSSSAVIPRPAIVPAPAPAPVSAAAPRAPMPPVAPVAPVAPRAPKDHAARSAAVEMSESEKAEMRESMEELRRSLQEHREQLEAAREAMEAARAELQAAAREMAELGARPEISKQVRRLQRSEALELEAQVKAAVEAAKAHQEIDHDAIVRAVREDIRRAAEDAAKAAAQHRSAQESARRQAAEDRARSRAIEEQARKQAEEAIAKREQERERERERERAKD